MLYQERRNRKRKRTEQDSNLRGQSPLDFESNALTTRPSVPQWVVCLEMFLIILPLDQHRDQCPEACTEVGDAQEDRERGGKHSQTEEK